MDAEVDLEVELELREVVSEVGVDDCFGEQLLPAVEELLRGACVEAAHETPGQELRAVVFFLRSEFLLELLERALEGVFEQVLEDDFVRVDLGLLPAGWPVPGLQLFLTLRGSLCFFAATVQLADVLLELHSY